MQENAFAFSSKKHSLVGNLNGNAIFNIVSKIANDILNTHLDEIVQSPEVDFAIINVK